jgi:NagD protein
MLDTLLARHRLERTQLAMVGDRLYTDMAMAQRCGALAALVLTGETTLAQAMAADSPPDVALDHVGKLGELLDLSRADTASDAEALRLLARLDNAGTAAAVRKEKNT